MTTENEKDKMKKLNDPHGPIKDEHAAHPIPAAWRPVLRGIVDAFTRGDYALAGGVQAVAPVSAATATQIERFVASYGETLAALPEETWGTSIAQWMGAFWDVLVDLWTSESGESDLVLSVRVFEAENDFWFEVLSIHVP